MAWQKQTKFKAGKAIDDEESPKLDSSGAIYQEGEFQDHSYEQVLSLSGCIQARI